MVIQVPMNFFLSTVFYQIVLPASNSATPQVLKLMGLTGLSTSAYRRQKTDAIGLNLLPGPPSLVGVLWLLNNFVVHQCGMIS